MMKKTVIAALALLLIAAGCSSRPEFARVEDGRFAGVEEQYFIGTNFWYGPLLASEHDSSGPVRLQAELDTLLGLGITNLRVMVGSDGIESATGKVEPVIHTRPYEYDEGLLEGLDRFLAEAGQRGMKVVLFLTNSWEWTGGMAQYMHWNGAPLALPSELSWDEYCEAISRFYTDEASMKMFESHVRAIVGRRNGITGVRYCDDPAIFSWQICNEPRPFSSDPEVKEAFAQWIIRTAALIKSVDRNHMVSTGSEGLVGSDLDMDLYRRVHSCPDIDYLNIHIWPMNWSWIGRGSVCEDLPEAVSKAEEYIDAHLALARELGKPLVIEEFGYPRDGLQFDRGTPTESRDGFYECILSRLAASAEEGDMLAGVNFWGWGGFASQSSGHLFWQVGDDYCCDPPMEQRGLYSVYISDRSTVSLIDSFVKKIKKVSE